MKVIGYTKGPDWPKIGPSMLIAAALVVAIRTARWAARGSDLNLSDVDPALDRKVGFAVRVTQRVFHALLKTNPAMFPQRNEPLYAPDETDVPR